MDKKVSPSIYIFSWTVISANILRILITVIPFLYLVWLAFFPFSEKALLSYREVIATSFSVVKTIILSGFCFFIAKKLLNLDNFIRKSFILFGSIILMVTMLNVVSFSLKAYPRLKEGAAETKANIIKIWEENQRQIEEIPDPLLSESVILVFRLFQENLISLFWIIFSGWGLIVLTRPKVKEQFE